MNCNSLVEVIYRSHFWIIGSKSGFRIAREQCTRLGWIEHSPPLDPYCSPNYNYLRYLIWGIECSGSMEVRTIHFESNSSTRGGSMRRTAFKYTQVFYKWFPFRLKEWKQMHTSHTSCRIMINSLQRSRSFIHIKTAIRPPGIPIITNIPTWFLWKIST